MKTNNHIYGFMFFLALLAFVAWRVFMPEIMALWTMPVVNVAIRAIFGTGLAFVFLYSLTNK